MFYQWTGLSLTIVWVSGFVLLFYKTKAQVVLDAFSPIGKMSMTNYIAQSVVGSFIYYGFGLGMYNYTGATIGLLIGTVLALLQLGFCTYWFKSHKRGPLEELWHKLTWIGSKKSFRNQLRGNVEWLRMTMLLVSIKKIPVVKLDSIVI